MGFLATFGVAAVLFNVSGFIELYCYISCLVFFLSFIGGIMHYNSTELKDWRDIYREKNKMQMEKIKQLNHLLSVKEHRTKDT